MDKRMFRRAGASVAALAILSSMTAAAVGLLAGATAAIDTETPRRSVIGCVLTNAGPMANLSMGGTRIVRSDS